MRIIARRTLREFVEKHAGYKDQPALKAALEAWFDEVRKARWASAADVKRLYRTASIITAERVVFNIKGNDYRLVAAIDHEKSILWIKWLGAHADYDHIDVRERWSMTAEVKPIRSNADHEAALTEIERLWRAKAGTPDGDRLDVLATLIDAYESEHYPIDPPDPKFRMEQQGLTQRDLEAMLGTRARVTEILNRKRDLSIGMISKIARTAGHLCGSVDPPGSQDSRLKARQ